MYLVLLRKPHTVLHFAEGAPPKWFTMPDSEYVRLSNLHLTAAWRVDEYGFPVAVTCRLAPGEQWLEDILALPRLDYRDGVITFWLTTERNFERRDILCDEVALYQAGFNDFAFVFSMEGISQPHKSVTIKWP